MSKKNQLKELPLKEPFPPPVIIRVIAPLAGELVKLGLEINKVMRSRQLTKTSATLFIERQLVNGFPKATIKSPYIQKMIKEVKNNYFTLSKSHSLLASLSMKMKREIPWTERLYRSSFENPLASLLL